MSERLCSICPAQGSPAQPSSASTAQPNPAQPPGKRIRADYGFGRGNGLERIDPTEKTGRIADCDWPAFLRTAQIGFRV